MVGLESYGLEIARYSGFGEAKKQSRKPAKKPLKR
jgi:hypothetical protein